MLKLRVERNKFRIGINADDDYDVCEARRLKARRRFASGETRATMSFQHTTVFSDFPQHFGRYVFVRQLLKDFLATLANITAAREDEGQWADRLRHGAQRDFISRTANRLARHS